VGGAAVAALLTLAEKRGIDERRGVVMRVAFWSIAVGVSLYAVTRGPVFDRYLVAWYPLLPAVWSFELSRWGRVVQAVLLLAMFAYFLQQLT